MTTGHNTDEVLLDDLRRHESYRKYLYVDPVKGRSALTIGYGYNVSANGLPKDIAEVLLVRYAEAAEVTVRAMFPPAHFTWLNAEHYRVMANIVYQLGAVKFRKFVKFIAAVGKNDLETARLELIDSAWFRQSGVRSKELVQRWENASA